VMSDGLFDGDARSNLNNYENLMCGDGSGGH